MEKGMEMEFLKKPSAIIISGIGIIALHIFMLLLVTLFFRRYILDVNILVHLAVSIIACLLLSLFFLGIVYSKSKWLCAAAYILAAAVVFGMLLSPPTYSELWSLSFNNECKKDMIVELFNLNSRIISGNRQISLGVDKREKIYVHSDMLALVIKERSGRVIYKDIITSDDGGKEILINDDGEIKIR